MNPWVPQNAGIFGLAEDLFASQGLCIMAFVSYTLSSIFGRSVLLINLPQRTYEQTAIIERSGRVFNVLCRNLEVLGSRSRP